MTNTTEQLLPEAGKGRWWKVALDKKAPPASPIRVSLMEMIEVEGKTTRTISTEIGYSRSIAEPKNISHAAHRVLVRVGGYIDVVGEYPTIPTEAPTKE